jgi:hypothetical protein
VTVAADEMHLLERLGDTLVDHLVGQICIRNPKATLSTTERCGKST